MWARNCWCNPFYSPPFPPPPPLPLKKMGGQWYSFLSFSEGGWCYTCASATAAKTLLLKSRFFCFKLCRGYCNGPLQLAIPVIQNRRNEERKWHWNMTNKGNWNSKFCMPFVFLVPVRLTLSSREVLYHGLRLGLAATGLFAQNVSWRRFSLELSLKKIVNFGSNNLQEPWTCKNELNCESFIWSEFDVNAKKWFSYQRRRTLTC